MLYRYSGPLTAMTLADGREVILSPGAVVDLPEEADVTQTLVALGRLAPEPAAPKSKPRKEGDA
ncbi:MAG: hypothetical protein N2690_10595 [Rhodocyclaceae bacterium]|nr:hypothetical protein [Rhodocyclaceae bacterium]